jgi:hypothetical protein
VNAASPAAASPGEVALARLGSLLYEWTETARGLHGAVLAGDRGAARAAVVTLEGLTPALAAANRTLAQNRATLPPDAGALLAALTGGAEVAERALGEALAARQARSIGDWLAAGEDAETVARRLLAAPWQKQQDLLILLGAGAAALAERAAALGQKRIFALDPTAPEQQGSADDRPQVVNVHSLAALEGACWHLRYPSPGSLRFHIAGGGLPNPVDEIVERLQRVCKAVSESQWEIEAYGATFVHTAARNLPRLATTPSLHALAGAFAGLPAVVVSAGPSLDRNIEQLRALQGHAVIIGINQTVRALRRAGVRPDIVVAIDPQNIRYHFDGTGPDEIGALCLGASVAPVLFDLPCAQRFTFASSPVCESWAYDLVDEQASLNTGGTVATAAVQLAVALGCSPVISIGRDLALAGHKYYADGAADGGGELTTVAPGKVSMASLDSKYQMVDPSRRAALRERLDKNTLELCQIPGFFGAPVTSTTGFVYEIDLLRTLVRNAPAGTRFLNATEGGAFLEGMEHLTLAEVIARHGAGVVDARAVIAAKLAEVPLPARRQRMTAGLAGLSADLRRAAELADLARRGGKRAKDEKRAAAATAELRRLSAQHVVLSVLAQRATRDVGRSQTAGWTGAAEVETRAGALFTAIADEARGLATEIDTALGELEAMP